MDALSGLTASQKALDAFKALPVWIIAAIVASSIFIYATDLRQDLPGDVVRWFPLLITVSGTVLICRLGAELLSYIKMQRFHLRERERDRLRHLYRPLAILFVTRHMTVCNFIGAPYLRDRFANSLEELGAYRRRTAGLRNAFYALFDRKMSTSAQIEYGGYFPMNEISKIVHKHADRADQRLLEMVRRADRSLYEDRDSGILTDEQYDLFMYISKTHKNLSNRYF